MPTLPQLNILSVPNLVFLVTFFAFVIALGYSLYYWLHERHQKKDTRTIDPRDAAVEEAVKIVDGARQKAMSLLHEANVEAKSIFHDSTEIKSETKDLFEQRMQQLTQKQMQAFDVLSHDLLESYKAVLGQEKESSLKSFVEISDALKQQLTSEVRTFANTMKQTTSDTETTIREDMKNQYNQVSTQMGALAESLKNITSEAEQNMKGSLGDQYGQVQEEISHLSENIRKVTEEAEGTIKTELMGQYDKLKSEVGGLAENLKAVTEETENKIKQDINQEYEQAKEVVHNFAESMRQATVETENTLKNDVKNEYNQIKEDLKNYKDDRMQKIDKLAMGMMEEVARDVLGKTMNSKDHEELIIRSLDGIKRTTNLKEL